VEKENPNGKKGKGEKTPVANRETRPMGLGCQGRYEKKKGSQPNKEGAKTHEPIWERGGLKGGLL